MKKPIKINVIIGISFLLIQILSIFYARFIPERFFCWAPYDEHSYYEIKVSLDGKRLTDSEIRSRYRYSPKGWEPRSMDNIFSLVRQYENTYGLDDDASIVIEYKTNGHKQQQWKP